MDFAVSSAMTIQDHSDDGDSCALFPGGNGILLDDGGLTTTDGGYVPKIRKPYTITKQRGKWTEEEHKKFIEALKLYGRAWRKIEEHVGTKTAVQIRSHAQKFFSKVVRESKSSQCSSTKPIEIPPPRLKRKPMHPYPRKLALPAKTDMFLQEQLATSTSPNSSSVDQEQQSPTSVLSAFVSETVGSADSGTLDGNSSLTSPHEMNEHDVYMTLEANPMVQENALQSDAPMSAQQLELFPKVGFFIKEESTEATPTKSVKLFGKTLLLDNAAQAMEVVGPSAPVPLRAFSGGMPFPFKNTKTQANANLKRSNSEKYTRAFVPYKRSLSENEMQRTRLCL